MLPTLLRKVALKQFLNYNSQNIHLLSSSAAQRIGSGSGVGSSSEVHLPALLPVPAADNALQAATKELHCTKYISTFNMRRDLPNLVHLKKLNFPTQTGSNLFKKFNFTMALESFHLGFESRRIKLLTLLSCYCATRLGCSKPGEAAQASPRPLGPRPRRARRPAPPEPPRLGRPNWYPHQLAWWSQPRYWPLHPSETIGKVK